MYDGVDVRTFMLYFFPTLFTGHLPLDFCGDCRDDLYEKDGGVPPGNRDGRKGNHLLPTGRTTDAPAEPSSDGAPR